MLGAGEMMEESYDEAGIRPRPYNGPEKGKKEKGSYNSYYALLFPDPITIMYFYIDYLRNIVICYIFYK